MNKPKKHAGGRPRTVTLEKVKGVGNWIALGMTEEQACLAEEVSYAALKKAQQRRPEFVLAIKRAQVQFLKRALSSIANGGEVRALRLESGALVERLMPWTGLAWLLERRHKPQFNRTDGALAIAVGAEGGAFFTEADLADLARMAKEMFVR